MEAYEQNTPSHKNTGNKGFRRNHSLGYDGHIFGTKVHIQGGKAQSAEIKSKLKQRARIEPVISRLKADHRMDRNRLHHTQGDILNCLMAGCAFNLRKLMKWLKNEVFYLYFISK